MASQGQGRPQHREHDHSLWEACSTALQPGGLNERNTASRTDPEPRGGFEPVEPQAQSTPVDPL